MKSVHTVKYHREINFENGMSRKNDTAEGLSVGEVIGYLWKHQNFFRRTPSCSSGASLPEGGPVLTSTTGPGQVPLPLAWTWPILWSFPELLLFFLLKD